MDQLLLKTLEWLEFTQEDLASRVETNTYSIERVEEQDKLVEDETAEDE